MAEARSGDASAEIRLERLKQRYQLASVILGTGLVSVLGSWLAFAEKTQVNENTFDQGHRDYVADFVDLALENDIERRLRFASYFARVTLDTEQRVLWQDYERYLVALRTENQTRLAEIETATASETATEEELRQLRAERDFLQRQLDGSTAAPPATLDSGGQRCMEEHADIPAQWLCIAEHEIGVREIPGAQSNQRILGYASSAGLEYEDDDIPWTGLFVAWVVSQADGDVVLPANPLAARNWLEFGAATAPPGPGDILVFWRGSRDGLAGHVGFYSGEDDTHYQVLGGNQSNSVNIMRLPKDRLLGARTAN